MTPDFDSAVVLGNSVRILRSEVLPAVTSEEARLALIRVIAVIESHLAQLTAEDPGSLDESSRRAALMGLDGTMLMAFGGRLQNDQGDARDGST